MGCLGYVILGLFVLWLLESFSLGKLLLAFIVGYLIYHALLD